MTEVSVSELYMLDLCVLFMKAVEGGLIVGWRIMDWL